MNNQLFVRVPRSPLPKAKTRNQQGSLTACNHSRPTTHHRPRLICDFAPAIVTTEYMDQQSLASEDAQPPAPSLHSVACFTVAHAAHRIVARLGHNVAVPREFTSTAAAAFWQTAAQAVGEELAIIIAQDLPLGSFGRAGYHTISVATLGQALNLLGMQYISQMAAGLALHVIPVSKDAVDIVVRSVGTSWLSVHLEELAIAVLHHQLLNLAARVSAEQVTLRRSAPTSVLTSRWRSLFGLLPTFGHHQSAIRITNAALLAPLRTADPDVARRMCDDQQSESSHLRQRVCGLVRARLQNPPNGNELAAALRLTPRTMQPADIRTAQTSCRGPAALWPGTQSLESWHDAANPQRWRTRRDQRGPR